MMRWVELAFSVIKPAFFLACLISSSVVLADPLFLTLPLESSGQAISNAQVSYARGVNAVRYNPAGLGFASGIEAQATHLILGEEISADNFTATYPFAEFFSVGIFGSVMYLNESFKKVEDFVETDTTLSVVDTEFGVSGGYQVSKDLAVGVTMRYFRFQLGPEVSQSFNSDIGAMYEFNLPFYKSKGFKRFAAGVTVKNLGPAFSFFGSGEAQGQPIQIQGGLSYKGNRWFTPSVDYIYSLYDGSSVHLGLDILPRFYVSPKLGLQHARDGLSFSVGGGVGYGKSYRINAIGGTSLGGSANSNTFVSLLFQKRDFATQPRAKPAGATEKITLDRMDSLYKPHDLVPFKSGYRAEKVQGITLSLDTASGFRQKTMKLKRIAVQPEDEEYLKQMAFSKKKELYLTGRKIALWLNLKSIPVKDEIGWWDSFASVIEGSANFEVLTGTNLGNLNKNKNAPLRVEIRLDVSYTKKEGRSELRTALVELYTNKLLLAKTFTIYQEDSPFQVWQDVGLFYSSYLKNIKGFYKYQMVLPKQSG